MRRMVVLWCALAVFATANAREDGPVKTVHGFLTNGKVVNIPDSKASYVIPGVNELEFAWSDEPLVVHIPFTLQAPKDEPIWVLACIGFEGFTADGKCWLHDKNEIERTSGSSASPRGAYGIARLGDKQWHDGIRVGRKQLVREATADYAVGTQRRMLKLLRIPSGQHIISSTSRVAIYFPAGSPRGSYSLWFTVPARAIWKYGSGLALHTQPDEITGRFKALLFAVRQERAPDSNELKVAAGLRQPTRPDRPNLSLWNRLSDVQVDVTTRANGWVIDKGYTQKATGKSGYWDVERELSGSRGTFQGSEAQKTPKRSYKADYRITLPHRIRDWSMFDVQVNGSLAVHDDKGDPTGPWNIKCAGGGFIEGMPRSCRVDANGKEKSFAASVLLSDEYGKRRAKSWTREEWAKKYPGLPHYWLPPNDWHGYKPGNREGVFRMTVGAPSWLGSEALNDRGPYALIKFTLGSAGEVVQTYRRRSDVESNHKGKAKPTTVTVERPKKKSVNDGFPKWYQAVYCPAVARAHTELDIHGSTAAAIGLAVAGNRKHIRILRDALSVQSEYRSQAAWNRIQRRMTDLEGENRQILALLGNTVEKAEAMIVEIIALIEEQAKTSATAGRKREELKRWHGEWADKLFRTALDLYLKGEDHESWDAQMAERDLKALPAHQQWQLAHMYLDRDRVARALFVMRSLVRASPNSPEAAEARLRIASLEAKILRAVAAKMSGEVHESRQKFFRWLESRGLTQKEPAGLLGRGFEYFWTILSTGPGALASWMSGRTDAMEEESRTVQEAGTATWLGLKAIIALAERGTTLEQVADGLDGFELRERLRLEKATGKSYSSADYAALGTQIRMAVALPEVKALLAESEDLLNIELGKAHFRLDTVDLSELMADRWEYGFDLFSAKNTAMLLLPMSVGTIGGKLVPLSWQPWGLSKANNAVKAARFLGHEVRTGQEMLAVATGWASAIDAVAATNVGLRIHRQLALLHQSGGIVWKSTWAASPLLADVALGYGIVTVAHKYGGPHIAAATEAVVYTFLWDPTLLGSLMRRSRTTPAMIQRLAKRYGREVSHYEREMKRTREYLIELREVLRARKTNPARLKQITSRSPLPPRKPPPTVTAPPPRRPPTTEPTPSSIDHDAKTVDLSGVSGEYSPGRNHLDNQRHAVAQTNAAIDSGDWDEAARWAEAAVELEKAAERQLGHLRWVRHKLADVAVWLGDKKITQKVKVALSDFVDLGWKKGPTKSDFDGLVFEADYLRLKGDFAGAAKKYRAAVAVHGIEQGNQKGAIDTLKKLHIMEEALHAQRTAPSRMHKTYPFRRKPRPEKFERAVVEAKNVKPLSVASKNPVYPVVVGSQQYALKRMSVAGRIAKGADDTPAAVRILEQAIEKEMRAELAAAAIGDLFGVSVAPAVGRMRRDAEGHLVGEIMTQWVLSPDLEQQSIGKLLALKDQYAEHRVFSMVIGDYDRHLGNYAVNGGYLITMDCGQGQLMRSRRKMSEAEIDQMQMWIVDHWYGYRAKKGGIDKNHKMLEQSLVFQDMAPAFDRARKIFAEQKDEVRRRLRAAMDQIYDDAGKAQDAADEALEEMEKRLGWIEERTKVAIGERNGFPLTEPVHRTNWLRPRSRSESLRGSEGMRLAA